MKLSFSKDKLNLKALTRGFGQRYGAHLVFLLVALVVVAMSYVTYKYVYSEMISPVESGVSEVEFQNLRIKSDLLDGVRNLEGARTEKREAEYNREIENVFLAK